MFIIKNALQIILHTTKHKPESHSRNNHHSMVIGLYPCTCDYVAMDALVTISLYECFYTSYSYG